VNILRVYMFRNQKSITSECAALIPFLSNLTESMLEKLSTLFQNNEAVSYMETNSEYKN